MMAGVFDPATFHIFPDGVAIHRRDLVACRCGNTGFTRLRSGSGRTRTVCRRCVKAKPDEVEIDHIETLRWKKRTE